MPFSFERDCLMSRFVLTPEKNEKTNQTQHGSSRGAFAARVLRGTTCDGGAQKRTSERASLTRVQGTPPPHRAQMPTWMVGCISR